MCAIVYYKRYTVPKKNLNLRIKTEPVTVGADATRNDICLVSKPDVHM